MKSRVEETVVSYVPSPHRGYLNFFREHAGGVLYVMGNDFIQEFPSLVRNLPAAQPEEIQRMVWSLGIFSAIRILTKANLHEVVQLPYLIMPDEDVSRELANKYFSNNEILFDAAWRLRWDWGSVQKGQRPDGRVVTQEEWIRAIMRKAYGAAERSPDWWRQIGAVLSRDGEPLVIAFNQHVPNEQSAYLYGDPRSQFEAGKCIEVSGALHAEMAIAAEVMRRGICTKGCDLSVTTFPCPPCAYPWAFSDIRRLYYVEGYSLVSAAETLEAKEVEIIRVQM